MALRIPRRRRLQRKRRGPRKGMRKMRINRTLNPMKDKARVVEVLSSANIQGGGSGVNNFTLSLFPRALAVAAHYRYYRATRVELEFIPYANIYAPGTAFPELYYQQDYTAWGVGALAPTLASMEGRGVMPVKWTSPIKRTYNPAVLRFEQFYTQVWNAGAEYYVNDVQPISATPVKNKWYMTQQAFNPSGQGGNPAVVYKVGPAADPTNVIYTGSAFFINTPIAMAGNIGRVVCKVHWEFKEPLVPATKSITDLSGNEVPPAVTA